MEPNDQRDIVDLLSEIANSKPGGPAPLCLYDPEKSWASLMSEIATRAKGEIVALRTLHMPSPGTAKTADRSTQRPIQPGDTVVTKFGGPTMLAVRFRQTQSPKVWLVDTTWFDKRNRIVCHTFDEAALRLWHPPQETTPTQPQPQTTPSLSGDDLIHIAIAAIACDGMGWDYTAKALRDLRRRALEASSPAPADAPSLPIVDQAVMDREPAEMTPYCPRAARAAIDDPLPQDPRLYGDPHP